MVAPSESIYRSFVSCPQRSVVIFAALVGCANADSTPTDDAAAAVGLREGQSGQANIATPEGIRTVTYVVTNGHPVVAGDIMLPDDVMYQSLWAAPGAGAAHWPGGVVPYVIDSSVSDGARLSIDNALEHYQRETAVRLRPWAGEPNRVTFRADPNDAYCRSQVGMNGNNQYVNIGPDGCSRGAMIHELAHALGMWHEQQRPDRDTYIIVENLADNAITHSNFDVHLIAPPPAELPYDIGSIMHYGSSPGPEFAQDPGTSLVVMRRRSDGSTFSQNVAGLSDLDLRGMEAIYPAAASEAPSICRTAPQRGPLLFRADVAEIWEDVGPWPNGGPLMSIATHLSTGISPPAGSSPPGTGFKAPDAPGANASPSPNPAANRAGGWSVRTRWAAGDFDGDGDQDLVSVWNDGGSNTITFWRSESATIMPNPWKVRVGIWNDSTQWLPGDFNHDGRTDLMQVFKTVNNTTGFQLFASDGARFVTSWAMGQGGWSDLTKWNVGDFNLDGWDDILSAWPEGTGTTLTVRRSTPNGLLVDHWIRQTGGWASTMQWLVGNFDGLGGPDVMAVWNDGGTATLTFYRNQGATFAAGLHWAQHDGGWSNNVRWSAGDYNADGRDDVLALWNESGRTTLSVRRSTGLASPRLATEHWGIRRAGWQDSASWCTGSFNWD